MAHLKLTYFSSGSHEEIFVAVDDDDLEDLKLALLKAQAKSRALHTEVVAKLRLADFGTSAGKEDDE